MEESYKFTSPIIAEPMIVPDQETQIIEVTKTVEQKETFTIRQLKQRINTINDQIAGLEDQKASLLKKIDDASVALNITVTPQEIA